MSSEQLIASRSSANGGLARFVPSLTIDAFPGEFIRAQRQAMIDQRSRPRRRRRRPNRRPEGEAPLTADAPSSDVQGYVELVQGGSGWLRSAALQAAPGDIQIPAHVAARYGLRPGDDVQGLAASGRLVEVRSIGGRDPRIAAMRPAFNDLGAEYPESWLQLERGPTDLPGRILDLLAPLGCGQRALIVSPPKAGKTFLLRAIADGVRQRHPEVKVFACLIGERPEEVTGWRREVDAEVVSSTFDEKSETHIRVAGLLLERAKRRVEMGEHVVVLLDSITRLTRGYNLGIRGGSRTLSGGIDAAALQPARQFFGAARAVPDGGSLTIVGTCLVDTNSRMDDVIFQEFKGTGNAEIVLDRELAERRLYPAINVQRSSTRNEELLLDERALRGVWALRRRLAGLPPLDAAVKLRQWLEATKSNAELLAKLAPSDG